MYTEFFSVRVSLLISFMFMSILLIPGCSSVNRDALYYEDPTYRAALFMYFKNDPNLDLQIELMNEYLNNAKKYEMKVAPGAYAHMGTLLMMKNDPVASKGYFLLEKENFPESSKYIDFVLDPSSLKNNPNLTKNQQTNNIQTNDSGTVKSTTDNENNSTKNESLRDSNSKAKESLEEDKQSKDDKQSEQVVLYLDVEDNNKQKKKTSKKGRSKRNR